MRSIAIGTLLALIAIPAAFAESGTARLDDGNIVIIGEEVDLSARMIEENLRHSGYRQIMFLKNREFSVSAYDREGSEVFLQINPQTGDVLNSRYVHAMDE